MNLALLLAEPPLVLTAIFPVLAPLGTVAVICESEFTVKVAATPPKVTLVVCLRPLPVMTTEVPTGPCAGVKPVSLGSTRNVWLLVRVVAPVVTVTAPVRAPAGTVAVM